MRSGTVLLSRPLTKPKCRSSLCSPTTMRGRVPGRCCCCVLSACLFIGLSHLIFTFGHSSPLGQPVSSPEAFFGSGSSLVQLSTGSCKYRFPSLSGLELEELFVFYLIQCFFSHRCRNANHSLWRKPPFFTCTVTQSVLSLGFQCSRPL